MIQDHMQRQRFEQKYLLSEEKAARARDFIDTHLERDPNGVGRPEGAYPVYSLYLDSDNLDTYWWTISGLKNRFKLRLRYYDDRPDTPVYFEIKRRVDRVILKKRAAVRKSAAPLVLEGQLPGPEGLLSQDPEHLAALGQFIELAQRLQARPRVQMGYWREAWNDAWQPGIRATLDRRVATEAQALARLSTRMKAPCFPFGRTVILELKFTGRFPDWFREMVEALELVQSGAAKYGMGVTMIGPERLGHRLQVFAEHGLDPATLLESLPSPDEEGVGAPA